MNIQKPTKKYSGFHISPDVLKFIAVFVIILVVTGSFFAFLTNLVSVLVLCVIGKLGYHLYKRSINKEQVKSANSDDAQSWVEEFNEGRVRAKFVRERRMLLDHYKKRGHTELEAREMLYMDMHVYLPYPWTLIPFSCWIGWRHFKEYGNARKGKLNFEQLFVPISKEEDQQEFVKFRTSEEGMRIICD